MTVSEESALVTFYAAMIVPLCGREAGPRRRPDKVACTAHQFLRRFYLSNSVVHFDPLKIMVASIFLASKVEVSLEEERRTDGVKDGWIKAII